MIYSMRDLHYYLIEGDAEWLENFQILEKRRLGWHEGEVLVHALGTSHAVSMLWRGIKATELLSCRGHLNMKPVFAEMSASRPFELSTEVGCLRYHFQLTFQPLTGNDKLVGSFPPEDQISVAYPPMPGLDIPLTRIGWTISPGVLKIETLHTYPEEANGVRTESRFEIAGQIQSR